MKWVPISLIPLIFPFILSPYFVHITIMVLIHCVLAVSLNLICGYAEQMSLGHAGFYAIGAYTSAILVKNVGLPFWITIFLAGLCASAISVTLGIPSFKVRGTYLTFITIGFVSIISTVLNRWENPYTGGAAGIAGIPRPRLPFLSFETTSSYYYIVFFFFIFSVLSIYVLVNSRYGRFLMAIREDEVAAASLGVNVNHFKLMAFVISAFFAGLAGSLYAHYFRYISPDAFTILLSINLLAMIVVGGLGSIEGSILGATVVYIMPELLRYWRGAELYWRIVYGLIIVVIMIAFPDGLIGIYRKMRKMIYE